MCIDTLNRQKYLNTPNIHVLILPFIWQKIQLGAKMGIEIYRYLKFIVLALTLVNIFDFLTFHEVLIY